MPGTAGPASVSTKQQRIAQWARQTPGKALTSLSHLMDLDWILEAYRRTRKDGATGIDGQTAQTYEANLEGNLRSLLERAKSGDGYKAPPVRRVHIPKGDGSTRPLGIPTFEDKVLQRAVVMLLEPLYEQDFLDCSYGFRPRRSAHQALAAIQPGLWRMGGGWVLDVDVRKFFDSLDHAHLREVLGLRMRDGVITRLIGKWLKAGVWEDGCVTHPEAGTPQGGVISPILSNLFLHEVLDQWFEQEVKPRLQGQAFLVRYADDFVICCQREDDARRVFAVLPKRFGRFGLTLHPDKTRLLDFKKPKGPKGLSGGGDRVSFDFLGFTHYWGKSRLGKWIVRRKTANARLARAMKRIREWCAANRHRSVWEQWKTLVQKLKGHYGYYGITGNCRCLAKFQHGVQRLWRKWLSRRSQKGRINWATFAKMLERYPLPPPKVVHSIYRDAANP